jgi:hypothetical protein
MNVELEPQKHHGSVASAVPDAGDAVVIRIGTVMRWSATLIVLFALTTLAMGIAQTIGSEWGMAFFSPLDSGAESSVPTWFSVVLLGFGALAAFAIAAVTRPGRERRGWLILAVALTAMSIDEGAAIHERLIEPVRDAVDASGLIYHAWVIPGIIVVVLFVIAMYGFWRRLPRRTRLGLLAALGLYLAGAIGMEMLGGLFLTSDGPGASTGLTSLGEELLEMAGTAVLLGALLTHLSTLTPVLRLELRP